MNFFFKQLFVYNGQAVQQCDESQGINCTSVSSGGCGSIFFYQDQIKVSLIGSLHIALDPSRTQT